ncbi:MAG: 50S ribosome-binding GTPase [Candidatus Pacearchaeota archaeon]|jgi:ribosome-interacting GTPase 1
MPINVNDPEYVKAEKKYYEADTLEQKLNALKKMISHMPGHKGAENLRAQLKTRMKKLKEQIAKAKKSGKSTKIGIKKENHQVVIIGKTNSGKSTLVNLLTNAKPIISPVKFSTTQPVVGMTKIENINMQIIENPAIFSEYYDKGISNSADAIILLINSLEEINDLKPLLEKASKKQIILYNDKNNLSEKQLRKLKETMKSKKYNFVIINLSNPTNQSSENLKNKIFETFDKIRIYTKEPGQKKEKKPMILNPDSTVKDAAEKILKGFSKNIKLTKIWGPSSKFPGQVVGLNHKLKDLDVVEFKTR